MKISFFQLAKFLKFKKKVSWISATQHINDPPPVNSLLDQATVRPHWAVTFQRPVGEQTYGADEYVFAKADFKTKSSGDGEKKE